MRAYSVNVKGSTKKLIESKGLSGGGTNDTPFRICQYKQGRQLVEACRIDVVMEGYGFKGMENI